MGGPLEGIRVVDTSEGAQGPWAGSLLSDLGAEVIKVEKPSGEMMRVGGPKKRGHALPNMGMNHGKRNICLDLKRPEGQRVIHELIKWADVFLENWRPGVGDRLGCGYAVASQLNPRIVYCSASGFGQTGKYAHKGTVDNISQAMGGHMSVTGAKGEVGEKPRFIVIDFTSPLTVAQGIILALYARETTGKGQWVQCSQLETMIAVQSVRAAEYFMTGVKPVPLGTETPFIMPSQAFKTADSYVLVECPTEATWQALCQAIGQPKLATEPRFESNAKRVDHRAELQSILDTAFIGHTTEVWVKILEKHGVPCSEVTLDIEQLYEDPQVVANGLVVRRPHPVLEWVDTPDLPWKLSRSPAQYKYLARFLGEDNDNILEELGLKGELTLPKPGSN